MKSALLLMVTFVAVFSSGFAYVPRFLHGRPRDGFLGQPRSPRTENTIQSAPPPEQWFVQQLDHFNDVDLRTWKQRYFVNDQFYKPGGPLFIQIGGEGTASPIWLTEGYWMKYAQKYNAYTALLEHRYYGKSHPTPDMSSDNLQYLSSEQALSDLAGFITEMKGNLSNPKVITFGGSYPGSLSAWFRLKYPHLVDGAVASSAPLLAKYNFLEYLQVVANGLTAYNKTGACNNQVSAATQNIASLLQTSQGRSTLKQKFQLCDDIDISNVNDVSNLYSTLAGNFEGVVQYNKDNRAFEGAKGTNITIDTLCGIMADPSFGTPLDRYAQINTMLLNVYSEKCLDFVYKKMIDSLREIKWNDGGGRQWTYQTCTEFAFYQSSDYAKQPFGNNFPIEFWTKQCQDIFGLAYNDTVIHEAVRRTNINYGALGIKITKVLFPNGSIDPWHALGVLKDINPDARAIFIQGTAHCANMYPSTPQDPPQLIAARHEIETTIGKWLAAP